jgi:hypothetical protein
MTQIVSYTCAPVESPISNSGNFTTISDANFTGSLKAISGNLCEPVTTNAIGGAFWSGSVSQTGGTWPADQYGEVTITTESVGSLLSEFLIPVRQGAANSGTQYLMSIQVGSSTSNGVIVLFAFVAGTQHTLATYTSQTTVANDVYRLSVASNVLSISRNGTVTHTFTDTNNYIASGSPGFGLYSKTSLTQTQTALWAAGANQAATPTFSPPTGSYTLPQTVTITSSTSGGTIFYTLDGTTPTHSSSSVANGGTVSVTVPLVLKAFEAATDFADSATGTATYNGGVPASTTQVGAFIVGP